MILPNDFLCLASKQTRQHSCFPRSKWRVFAHVYGLPPVILCTPSLFYFILEIVVSSDLRWPMFPQSRLFLSCCACTSWLCLYKVVTWQLLIFFYFIYGSRSNLECLILHQNHLNMKKLKARKCRVFQDISIVC